MWACVCVYIYACTCVCIYSMYVYVCMRMSISEYVYMHNKERQQYGLFSLLFCLYLFLPPFLLMETYNISNTCWKYNTFIPIHTSLCWILSTGRLWFDEMSKRSSWCAICQDMFPSIVLVCFTQGPCINHINEKNVQNDVKYNFILKTIEIVFSLYQCAFKTIYSNTYLLITLYCQI